MVETYKTCCCIGHRKIEITEELTKEVYNYIENLIVNEKVNVFLFGSKSDFDYLCHKVVTDLKEKYPYIKRIKYTCKSESVVLENERARWEKILSKTQKKEISLLGVEEEFEHNKKYVSGKAAYVERNYSMIDDSEYCLFYYDETYLPPQRKYSKRSFGIYQPNSGTAVAYNYAKRKNKIIKNFYKE